MAQLFPTFAKIKKFPTKPTPGEWALLQFLSRVLDDTYEVYFQVHLNGEEPDVVVMREGSGVLIIEVKDWNLDCYEYVDHDNWRVVRDNVLIRSPIKQVDGYKDHLCSYHIPGLMQEIALQEKTRAVISTMVYFHNASNAALRGFMPQPRYTYLLGRDGLNSDTFRRILYRIYMVPNRRSIYFKKSIYDNFKNVLQPVEHDLEVGQFILFTKRQKNVLLTKEGRRKKVCGSAGSGKTQVLAKLAVLAYERTHSPVLILTFNITLRWYIHDMIRKICPHPDWNQFAIQHYHLFFEMYKNRNGMPIVRDKNSHDITKVRDYKGERYQTILVDEIQDFEPGWVRDIHSILAKNGEIVFFGDEHQNVYGRKMDTDKRPYTGIGGRWYELNESFRLASSIIELANKFQRKFLWQKYTKDEIPAEQESLNFAEGYIEYQFLTNFDRTCMLEFLGRMIEKYNFHLNDCCILCDRVKELRELEELLKQEKICTSTTFEDEETFGKIRRKIFGINEMQVYQDKTRFYELKAQFKGMLDKIRKNKKYAFRMNAGMLKLSTIQSFKGWEISNLVLILRENASKEEKLSLNELIYTAITRCKQHLLIVNVNNVEYDRFFQKALDTCQGATAKASE